MLALPITLLLFAGPGVPSDLTGMAQGILQETDQARQALAARDFQSARNHVDQALNLAAEIRGSSEQRPLMVPLYSERNTTTTYAPVKKGKDGTLTANRLKRDTSVRQVEGQITSASLNVTDAQRNLEQARAALGNGNPSDADAALQAVQGDVVQHTVDSDNLPLLRARENLMLARARVLDDKPKDARAPLRAAAQSVGDYERMALGPHSRQAVDLRREIDAYADVVNKQNKETSLARIDGWLNTLKAWQPEMAGR